MRRVVLVLALGLLSVQLPAQAQEPSPADTAVADSAACDEDRAFQVQYLTRRSQLDMV